MSSVTLYYLIFGAVTAIVQITASDNINDVYLSELCRTEQREFNKRSAVRDPTVLWDNAIIPYEFEENKFSEGQMGKIMSAMEMWMNETCIRFIPHTNEKDYILFAPNIYCYGSIGKQGGMQVLFVGSTCLDNLGVLAHELGHTLGLLHEHNRPDRDNYITILWENIRPGAEDFFQKTSSQYGQTFCEPYDYDSIMQYNNYIFSKNPNLPTMVSKFNASQNFGQRIRPSEGDNQRLRYLYGCEQFPSPCIESGSGEIQLPAIFLPENNNSRLENKELISPSQELISLNQELISPSQELISPSQASSQVISPSQELISPSQVISPSQELILPSHSPTCTSFDIDSLLPSPPPSSQLLFATPSPDNYIIAGERLGLKLNESANRTYWMECSKENGCKVTVCPGDTFHPRRHGHCPDSFLTLEKLQNKTDVFIRANDIVLLKPFNYASVIIGCGSGICKFKYNCPESLSADSTKKCSNFILQVKARGKKEGDIIGHKDIIQFEHKTGNNLIFCYENNKCRKKCTKKTCSNGKSLFHVYKFKD